MPSRRAATEMLGISLSEESLDYVHAAVVAGAADPYGDGDQSPIPPADTEATGLAVADLQQPMRVAWSTGLNLFHYLAKHRTSLHGLCFNGDVDGVRACIAAAREKAAAGDAEDAMKKVLEERVSMLRVTPLHTTCQGARMHGSNLLTDESGYAAIARMLLEAGARPDSRDICGLTPMSNAAAFESTTESCALVPLLVKFGADVNAISRFGEGMLPATIMRQNKQAFRALVQAGADMDFVDRTGLTCRKMITKVPYMMSLAVDAERRRKLSKKLCYFCGAAGANKLCGRCQKENYCSRECQRKDWKKVHKQLCKM